MKIYEVGGAVRDSLDMWNNQSPHDRDFVVEATLDSLKTFIESEKLGEILHVQERFLTLKLRLPTMEVVDMACTQVRADENGSFPETVTYGSLLEDLARRDFTVNAMAREVDYSLKPIPGTDLIDPYQGYTDLVRKELKFVGSPEQRLAEDGLRWLRGIRFIITKGFNPLPKSLTHHAIFDQRKDVLHPIAVERVQVELKKCFEYDTQFTMHILSLLHTPWWTKHGDLTLVPTVVRPSPSNKIPD